MAKDNLENRTGESVVDDALPNGEFFREVLESDYSDYRRLLSLGIDKKLTQKQFSRFLGYVARIIESGITDGIPRSKSRLWERSVKSIFAYNFGYKD